MRIVRRRRAASRTARDTTIFSVRGECGGRPATAQWRGGTLTAPVEVVRRVAVDANDWFGRDDGEIVEAAVDGDYLPALLTVMQAFGHVTEVNLRHVG